MARWRFVFRLLQSGRMAQATLGSARATERDAEAREIVRSRSWRAACSCAGMTSTAFGKGKLVEEVRIAQTANGKTFGAHVQLLETEDGQLVRFVYSTGGIARRGPVAFRPKDLAKLRAALAKTPRLRAALGFG